MIIFNLEKDQITENHQPFIFVYILILKGIRERQINQSSFQKNYNGANVLYR